jgi:hypothetical protein
MPIRGALIFAIRFAMEFLKEEYCWTYPIKENAKKSAKWFLFWM